MKVPIDLKFSTYLSSAGEGPVTCPPWDGSSLVAWEETVLLEGEPDRYAVLARRHEDVWYLAGINGLDEHMAVSPSLSFLPGGTYEGRCISSGETATDLVEQVSTYEDNQSLELVMKDKDGVVCVLRPQ